MSSCKYCEYNDQCTKSFCMQRFKKDQLFKYTLLTPNQCKHIALRPDADGTDLKEFRQLKEIQDNILEFVKERKNLYIHSIGSGNGKSSWCIRMIQAYIDKIWYPSPIECRALFISVPKFFSDLKDNLYSDSEQMSEIKQDILKADLVVWDEIGTKILSDFEHEKLLSYISNRLDQGKSNMYTSNLSPEELREKIGSRLYSRVVNNSIDIELHGSDKRGIV